MNEEEKQLLKIIKLKDTEIQKLKQKIAEQNEIIEKVNKIRNYKPKRVQHGEEYYEIDEYFDVSSITEVNDSLDDEVFEKKNYFSTREQGEEYLKLLKDILKMEEKE